MKSISVIFLLIFTCCSTNENQSYYPDGIDQPSEIVESRGCGNVYVYQMIDSSTSLVLSINSSKINLTQERQTIDLENSQEKVSVRLEKAGTSLDSIYFNYCTDLVPHNLGKLKIYNGKKGTITFSVSEDNPTTNFNVTIEVLDLLIYDDSNNLMMTIDKTVFWDVHVGWYSG